MGGWDVLLVAVIIGILLLVWSRWWEKKDK
jgi:hypothetical protein